jgi:hypothetical protein
MDRLPRPVPTIKPVGTIASVDNYKWYYSPAVLPGSLPPVQSLVASIDVTVLLLVGGRVS